MDDNLPLIGQSDTVLQWYPTGLIKHHCHAVKETLVIIIVTGFNNPSICGHCGRIFKAKAIHIEQTPSGPGAVLDIEVVVPTPHDQLM